MDSELHLVRNRKRTKFVFAPGKRPTDADFFPIIADIHRAMTFGEQRLFVAKAVLAVAATTNKLDIYSQTKLRYTTDSLRAHFKVARTSQLPQLQFLKVAPAVELHYLPEEKGSIHPFAIHDNPDQDYRHLASAAGEQLNAFGLVTNGLIVRSLLDNLYEFRTSQARHQERR